MTSFEGWSLLVSAVQCGLIAWGIYVMQGSNESREATLRTLAQHSQALERMLERTAS